LNGPFGLAAKYSLANDASRRAVVISLPLVARSQLVYILDREGLCVAVRGDGDEQALVADHCPV
jgi:hypothetical protein